MVGVAGAGVPHSEKGGYVSINLPYFLEYINNQGKGLEYGKY